MNLFLAIHSAADKDLEAAAVQGDTEIARRIAHGVERGAMQLESWLLTGGGAPTQVGGVDFRGQIPADRLDGLLEQLQDYKNLTGAVVACGVGGDSREAERALMLAVKRGGDPAVVLYTPEAEKELEETDKDPLGIPLTKAFGDAKPGEATKISSGSIRPSAAEPSAPSPLSAPSAPEAAPEQAPAQQAPDDSQKLLQAVGGVLKDLKAQLPQLEQLKQSNPAAYQAILEMSQAVVALAQKLTQPTVQKSESKPFRPHAPLTVAAHHHLNLPVGSVEQSRIKVVHADGHIGWVSVKAGQVMSLDGHAVSSRNPSGK